jgi:hypothetical protein
MFVHKLKKYFLLTLIISGIGTTCRAEGNLPFVDQKTIHFGFLLGINSMDFRVTPKDSARVSTLSPGFTVGIISDLRLNRYLNLRFTPTLHFGERQLTFKLKKGTDSTNISSVNISSIPICFPVYLKYSAERTGNYRPYLIWGAGVMFDLSTTSNSENPVTLKPLDFYTEFGAGCDIYFSFFKLAPELKYSIGFGNILAPVRVGLSPAKQRYTNALSALTSRMITLAFNFE